jgi:hypothetical protein
MLTEYREHGTREVILDLFLSDLYSLTTDH